MTAGLSEAVDRAGVAPGWWVTGVRNGSTVAHRLRLDAVDARVRTTTSVCGRRVLRPVDASDRQSSRSCGDCVKKAERALAPGPLAPSVGPPPVRRPDVPAAAAADGLNTAASRIARRAAFRESVMPSERSQNYVPVDYGAGHSSAVVVRAPLP